MSVEYQYVIELQGVSFQCGVWLIFDKVDICILCSNVIVTGKMMFDFDRIVQVVCVLIVGLGQDSDVLELRDMLVWVVAYWDIVTGKQIGRAHV